MGCCELLTSFPARRHVWNFLERGHLRFDKILKWVRNPEKSKLAASEGLRVTVTVPDCS